MVLNTTMALLIVYIFLRYGVSFAEVLLEKFEGGLVVLDSLNFARGELVSLPTGCLSGLEAIYTMKFKTFSLSLTYLKGILEGESVWFWEHTPGGYEASLALGTAKMAASRVWVHAGTT